MSEGDRLIRRIVVEGRVQGVGYRYFARSVARRLGVAGWVRNRSDGAVVALVDGPADAVEALIAELRRGPPGATVIRFALAESAETEIAPPVFEVRSTW